MRRLQSMYDEQQTTISTENTSPIVLQTNSEDYCQNLLEELHENPECANNTAVMHHNNSALRVIEEHDKGVESRGFSFTLTLLFPVQYCFALYTLSIG